MIWWLYGRGEGGLGVKAARQLTKNNHSLQHNINPAAPNEYTQAIVAVGEVIQDDDT